MSRMTSGIRCGAVAMAAALLLTACGSGAKDSSSADVGSKKATFAKSDLQGKGKKIVLFTYAPANEYISIYTETLKKQVEDLGYKIQVFTNTFSQAQEDQQVQQYLATGEKPALFLWIPFDDKGGINSTRLLSRVAPVIQLNQPLLPEGEKYVAAFSGDNNFHQGELMGDIMKSARDDAAKVGHKLGGEGGNTLVFHGSASNLASKERFRGFMDATKDEPFTILEKTNNLTPDEAYNNALTLIPKYKDKGIDFVWVYTGTTAAGVIKALEKNGLTPGKDVWVVDGNCGNPAQVTSGGSYGTTLQAAYVEGMSAAFTAVQFLASGGKVVKGETTYSDSETLPEVPLEAPHKFNYIPLASVQGGDKSAAQVNLWGKPFGELCVG